MTTITEKLPEQMPPWCPIHGQLEKDTCCPECDQLITAEIIQHYDFYEESFGG
jgi:hypothetical protein